MANDKLVEKIFMVDNMLGYRGGIWMWLCFFIPSVGVMFSEPGVTGEPRDFLLISNLFSCVTLLYFNFFFWNGVPASTPSMHAILSEAGARLLLLSYYGTDQVLSDGVIGSWNWVQVVGASIFGVGKLAQSMWVLWNRREYMAYENEQKEKMH